MTVGELIDLLIDLDSDMPVKIDGLDFDASNLKINAPNVEIVASANYAEASAKEI